MTDLGSRPGATAVAKEIAQGLATNPLLLSLVVLNAIGIGVAGWYLSTMHARQVELLKIVFNACLPK